MKKTLSGLLLILATQVNAQDKLTYTPENPKAGDLITIVYEPGSDLAGLLAIPDAVAYQMGGKQMATDIELKRSNRKLTGTVQTDTSANFLYFSFSSDGKFDNNYNRGYYIMLNGDDGKLKKGSYVSKSLYHQYYGSQAGVEKDNKLAIESYEKEFELYPESRKSSLVSYLRLYGTENKDAAAAKTQAEIENLLKAGLNEETDYSTLENLYNAVAKLPQQAKLISNLKKEKFPDGKWKISEAVNAFYSEQDMQKKEAAYNDIIKNINEKPDWKYLEAGIPGYTYSLLSAYLKNKKWDELKALAGKIDIADKNQLASMYNSLAWQIQKDSAADLQLAEQLSWVAIENAKKNLKDPNAVKPDSYTAKQWEKSKKSTYGMFADTYAMVQYKLGNYKKGLPYAKESALTYGEAKDADRNTTYALLAEKALSPSKYKSQLESFVKEGKSSPEVKEILSRTYAKGKKSAAGFDDYYAALEKEGYNKMLAELKKKMINEPAPAFALYNLEGKKTELSQLKGKVVVVDFWATWCGPCIASFPGMQKTQDKYKDDQNVKFLFVNTWENNIEDETKNAKDFVDKNKYTFDVLMDIDDKVITQYKVDGIPTKFIIDKEGNIRFKSVGFGGSDEKLVQELSAMIEMAGNAERKAF
ncbi:MAG TPA: TlpA disulfide reductase family protein [Chitinophagaceae bacterium]|nr:TlpA disulfide reductase family protein [Chitinophagaceae bacterium]